MSAQPTAISEDSIEESRAARLRDHLDRFKTWALVQAKESGLPSGTLLNSESLRQWDRKYNRRLIEKSFGTDEDIREAGVRALYSRVLGSYLRLDAFTAAPHSISSNPSYRLEVEMSTSIRGIYIPEASAEERETLIREQEDVIRRATKRLAYYNMPIERLTALFRELEKAVGGTR